MDSLQKIATSRTGRVLIAFLLASIGVSIQHGISLIETVSIIAISPFTGGGWFFVEFLQETYFFEYFFIFSFILLYGKTYDALRKIASKIFRSHSLESNKDGGILNNKVQLDARWLANDLRERAKELEVRANVFLFLIVMLLCGAVVLVIFAGRLTNLDVTAGNKAEIARNILRLAEQSYRDSLSDLRSAVDDYDKDNLAPSKKKVDKPKSNEPKSDINKDLYGKYFGENGIVTYKKLIHAQKGREFQAATENLIEANKSVLFEDNAGDFKDINFLYATGITRFGIIIIIFFFVKILLDFYKYSIKLSSFYKARADTIILIGKYDSKFHKILPELSPESLDFGKPPKLPADYFKNISEELLVLLSKKGFIKNDSNRDDKAPKSIADKE